MTSTRLPAAPKSAPVPATPSNGEPWTIAAARSLYNIEGWGIGFFDINDAGHVVVRPDRERTDRELDLFELANDLEEQGVGLPLLLRFSDILRSRIESLNEKFAHAKEEYSYQGGYTTVYPIKVNQQRHVVEEIVEFGKVAGVGLGCGSKPELQAVLGLAEHTDHLIVCNGYKDEEFMRLALMGQKLGHQVFIVLEQLSEVDVLLQVADGGGLGGDYAGSGSTSQASVNYTLQEYADDVIYTLSEACRQHELPMPHIISESGRALTAHHALLLLSVIDVESQAENAVPELTKDRHTLLHEMAADHASLSKQRVSRKRVREVYHDATFDKERAQELFNSGVLTLRDRAIAEQIYLSTIATVDR